MNSIDNSVVANDPVMETQPAPQTAAEPALPPAHESVTITVLEGMKVLFDEKAGLTPVQVVEKQKSMNG